MHVDWGFLVSREMRVSATTCIWRTCVSEAIITAAPCCCTRPPKLIMMAARDPREARRIRYCTRTVRYDTVDDMAERLGPG